MRIGTSGDNPPSYSLNGSSLTQVDKQCDLGIVVTSNLSWSEHFSYICSSAYSSLHFIRRNFPPSSPTALKRCLYLSLVHSKLSYCCQLWSPRLNKDITRLEKIQRRATKYILCDYSSNYKVYDWLN